MSRAEVWEKRAIPPAMIPFRPAIASETPSKTVPSEIQLHFPSIYVPFGK